MKKTPPATSLRFPGFRGFTLMETVIAIGVLAVLLTGFIAVFTPAAQGIRRSISSQQADRLTSTLTLELATLRSGQPPATAATGFEKAFTWLKEGNAPATAIFVYQYRGNPAVIRADGTPEPMQAITGQPGNDYIVQSMARRFGEMDGTKDMLEEDLKAVEGSVFFLEPTQLIYQGNQMVLGTPGTISYPEAGVQEPAATAADYKDAVIAFSAEFHSVPTKAATYLKGASFATRFNDTTKKPVFTRNLAVRR
jgi:prepilin-type N-terminal cleavage/methylation domain-containing protein